MKKTYVVSFRCFYDGDTYTQHRQELAMKDLGKWIESYVFTHPEVKRISMCVWPHDEAKQDNAQ